jgi:putative transposase
MTNLRRLRLTDRIFFITSNLLRHHRFMGPSEFEILIEVFEETRRKLGFALCGYVFMPDHWHALIWPRSPLTISQVLDRLKTESSTRIGEYRGMEGHFWQHRFWDRFVRNKREFNERLEYMHNNPVRGGLVPSPELWQWSSYNNFSLDRSAVTTCPIQIDYVHLSDDYRG